MSTLESLVPPLELCKQIPDGCFEDSAMVWATIWDDRTPFVVSREEAEGNGMDIIYPAPTLEEILCEFMILTVAYAKENSPTLEMDENRRISTGIEGLKKYCENPFMPLKHCLSVPLKAEDALKLWMELNKEDKEK